MPFVIVIAFWGLYYVGNQYSGAGETIATIVVLITLMLILLQIKSYLLRKISNK